MAGLGARASRPRARKRLEQGPQARRPCSQAGDFLSLLSLASLLF